MESKLSKEAEEYTSICTNINEHVCKYAYIAGALAERERAKKLENLLESIYVNKWISWDLIDEIKTALDAYREECGG